MVYKYLVKVSLVFARTCGPLQPKKIDVCDY